MGNVRALRSFSKILVENWDFSNDGTMDELKHCIATADELCPWSLWEIWLTNLAGFDGKQAKQLMQHLSSLGFAFTSVAISGMSEESVDGLIQFLQCQDRTVFNSLTIHGIFGSAADIQFIDAISREHAMSLLKTLHLDRICGHDNLQYAATSIANAVAKLDNLQTLSLERCTLESDTFMALPKIAILAKRLQSICISLCNLSCQHLDAFVDAIQARSKRTHAELTMLRLHLWGSSDTKPFHRLVGMRDIPLQHLDIFVPSVRENAGQLFETLWSRNLRLRSLNLHIDIFDQAIHRNLRLLMYVACSALNCIVPARFLSKFTSEGVRLPDHIQEHILAHIPEKDVLHPMQIIRILKYTSRRVESRNESKRVECKGTATNRDNACNSSEDISHVIRANRHFIDKKNRFIDKRNLFIEETLCDRFLKTFYTDALIEWANSMFGDEQFASFRSISAFGHGI